jgi:hypothetical protein
MHFVIKLLIDKYMKQNYRNIKKYMPSSVILCHHVFNAYWMLFSGIQYSSLKISNPGLALIVQSGPIGLRLEVQFQKSVWMVLGCSRLKNSQGSHLRQLKSTRMCCHHVACCYVKFHGNRIVIMSVVLMTTRVENEKKKPHRIKVSEDGAITIPLELWNWSLGIFHISHVSNYFTL